MLAQPAPSHLNVLLLRSSSASSKSTAENSKSIPVAELRGPVFLTRVSHLFVVQFLLYSFSRETPNRFRKELIKAAVNESHANGAVEVETLNKILINIGRPEERLSDEELNAILAEAGAMDDRIISVDKMLQLM